MQHDGGHEAQSTGAIRECPNGARASLDLDVQAFDAVRRTNSLPVFLRKSEVASRRRKAVLEALDGLGDLFGPALFELGGGLLGILEALALEDSREFVAKRLRMREGDFMKTLRMK